MLDWTIKSFAQLDTNELYDLIKLRIDVFVVEQDCPYSDLDGLDRESQTIHLFAYNDDKTEIVAYCRILAPNVVYDNESAIGRVIVSESVRGQKVGIKLMQQAISKINELWPEFDCHISAQEHLSHFYQQLGFEQTTEMYLEDGIPHIGMRKNKSQQ